MFGKFLAKIPDGKSQSSTEEGLKEKEGEKEPPG